MRIGYLVDILLSKLPRPLTARAITALSRRYIATRARHMAPTVMLSTDDDVGPNKWLLETALKAIAFANDHDLADLARKHSDKRGSEFYDLFPGDHYRLLSAITATIAPRSIVEIGTYTGMSAVTFLHSMPPECKLTAFDLRPWDEFETHLDRESFERGRITQRIADLSDPIVFNEYRSLLETADLIFCDAAKDGVFERELLKNLSRISPRQSCLLVFDDIRFLNMIDIWRSVASPKMDMTSFGHWTGTGLIDMSSGLKLK